MKHDLKLYKEAKFHLPNIKLILQVLNLAEKCLDYYASYAPVYRILVVLKEEKYILESYEIKYKKILDNKGLM
jgi:hypothetical protein